MSSHSLIHTLMAADQARSQPAHQLLQNHSFTQSEPKLRASGRQSYDYSDKVAARLLFALFALRPALIQTLYSAMKEMFEMSLCHTHEEKLLNDEEFIYII